MNADLADQRRFTSHFLQFFQPTLAAMVHVGSAVQISFRSVEISPISVHLRSIPEIR